MTLVLKSYLYKIPYSWVEKASTVYLSVSKDKLSGAYELPDETIVIGDLLSIEGGRLTEKDKELLKEIIGKEIEFILGIASVGTQDYLFFSKQSWPILRDYAILPEMGYVISAELKEARYREKKVTIFPKRHIVDE